MHLTKTDIENLERVQRLNIINSITGVKPANLIGTISKSGQPNLAIFSSVLHLGSYPALLGFMLRPEIGGRRHTYGNIIESGYYTINHIHESFIERAHYTSAKFSREESEFEKCQFTEEYLFGFKAPFVRESNLKIGMKFLQGISIEANNTMMMIGTVEHILFPDDAIREGEQIDLGQLKDVGISGLNTYYRLQKIGQFPYARKEALPDFNR